MNNSKNSFNKGAFLQVGFALLVLLVTTHCGVKPHPTVALSGTDVAFGGGGLPAHVFYTDAKKFLVHVTQPPLTVGQMSIEYHWTDLKLHPIRAQECSFEVRYVMPSMPSMFTTTAILTDLSSGNLAVLYTFSMGGLWNLKVSIFDKQTNTSDVFTQVLEVGQK